MAKKLTIRDFKPKDRRVDLVRWPGTERHVGLMQLNCAEVQAAHLAARARFRNRGQDVDEFSRAELQAEESLQCCYLMLIDQDACVADARVFASADQARTELGPDLREYFMNEHVRLQTELWEGWHLRLPNPQLAAIADILGLQGPGVAADDVVEAVARLREDNRRLEQLAAQGGTESA